MKCFLFVIAVLFSYSAMASCPNLTGVYTCFDSETGEQYINTYTQRSVRGHTVYTIVEEDFVVVTDNRWIDASDNEVTGRFKAFCKNNAVHAQFEGQFDRQAISSETVVRLSRNQLITTSRGTFGGVSYPEETEVCLKH